MTAVAYRVPLIPGDGIGPEVVFAAQACLNATGVPFEWEIHSAGEGALSKSGSALPEDLLESVRRHRVALKGPVTTPLGGGIRSVNVELRRRLDLYACVRPCLLYPGVPSRYPKVDLVVIRENTEDLYGGPEYRDGSTQARELIGWVESRGGGPLPPDSAVSLKPISYRGSDRIARFAFEYAIRHGRKKVTVAHKANIMKCTDGLFLKVARRVASDYAGRVAFEEQLVDSLCMQLVQHPESYDVLLLPNLYGDIVSDLCAGLIGGLGMAPGANFGEQIAVFEPAHGSAPRYQGQNRMNPAAVILSGILMLRHLGETDAADRLERAVSEVIREGRFVTSDLKSGENGSGGVTTRQMADAVVRRMESEVSSERR